MASYKIEIKKSAIKELRELQRSNRDMSIQLMEKLISKSRPADIERLRGFTDMYRVRQGDFRIVYEIIDGQLLITVIKVGHRREVYRDL